MASRTHLGARSPLTILLDASLRFRDPFLRPRKRSPVTFEDDTRSYERSSRESSRELRGATEDDEEPLGERSHSCDYCCEEPLGAGSALIVRESPAINYEEPRGGERSHIESTTPRSYWGTLL